MKFRILRALIGILVFGWLIDFNQDWQFFFIESFTQTDSFPFYNLLGLIRSLSLIHGSILIAMVLSMAFAAGFRVRWTGPALSYLIICFFQINPMLYTPALPFQIWLILALSLMGTVPAEQKTLGRLLKGGGWSLLAVGYFISGLDKWLHSESWNSGTALHYILSGSLSQWPWVDHQFNQFPLGLQHGLTRFIPISEILFLPFCISKGSRAFAWWIMTFCHVTILFVLWLPSVSIGMLLFHFFLIDEKESHPLVHAHD